MTINFMRFEQGNVLKDANIASLGVCLALCRKVAKAQTAKDYKVHDTVYELLNADTVAAVYVEQGQGGQINDTAVQGTTRLISSRRRLGPKGYYGLRRRSDVISHIFSVPGIYIYIATDANGSGHAFNFDSQDLTKISFFDPNQGEWLFTDETLQSVTNWWDTFWEAGPVTDDGYAKRQTGSIDYKAAFNRGKRRLVRYTAAQ